MLYIGPIQVHTCEGTIQNGCVVIDEPWIAAVAPSDRMPPPDGIRRLGRPGWSVCAGFIDLQVNGAFGKDLTSAPEDLWEVAAGLPRYGVTSFLPTIISSDPACLSRGIAAMRGGPPPDFAGARPLGLHAEGPCLNPVKRGAHPAERLLPASRTSEVLAGLGAPDLRLVTLAPELEGAEALAVDLMSRGVRVSAGHSHASLDEARRAFAAGVGYATHLFNAMPCLHHRDPGLVAAVLESPDVIAGLVADGVHVHPAMIALAWRLKGPRRLNLVSDAMTAAGMPDGVYELGDLRVTVLDRRATLDDGTIAGSVQMLDESLRKLVHVTGCTLRDALATITTTPADFLDLPQGRVEAGRPADLTLLDENLEVAATLVGGRVVYERQED